MSKTQAYIFLVSCVAVIVTCLAVTLQRFLPLMAPYSEQLRTAGVALTIVLTLNFIWKRTIGVDDDLKS